MGNCCATPKTTKEGQKGKKGKKENSFAVDYGVANGGGGGGKLTMLKSPTGRQIQARYELGRGEFGMTYLCTDKESGGELACKSISKKKLRTAIDIEDVRREVEIMRHLPHHTNIVTLRDTYEGTMPSISSWSSARAANSSIALSPGDTYLGAYQRPEVLFARECLQASLYDSVELLQAFHLFCRSLNSLEVDATTCSRAITMPP